MSQKPAELRLDIQALRAVAIASVVIYHFWPAWLPGGFAGVDIFFVVSGYLITGQLWRQVQLRGRIDFRNFWARRARRLLPASLLVIAVVVAVAFVRMPSSWFLKLRDEAVGSIFYFQNWVLAQASTDYLNADQAPSALQHFWSLSVEEQYYVAWPLLMFALLWIGRGLLRKSAHPTRLAVLGGLAAVLVFSLVYSIVFTAQLPLYAFFSTFTRAWEFAAGALLAVWLGTRDASADRARAQARNPIWWWLGVALFVVSFSALSNKTPYPSFFAILPVLGAVLFLFGGESASRWVPKFLLRFKPLQFFGDISYSLYLWHWPILMLSPWFIAGELNDWHKTGLVALSILVGWLSKRFVEDPIRFGRLSKMLPSRQLLFSGAAMVLVFVLSAATTSQATATLKATGGEDRVLGSTNLNDGIDFETRDKGKCQIERDNFGFKFCEKGDLNGRIRVGLIGDSHTRQYFTPVDNMAFAFGWKLTMISKSACPVANTEIFPASIPDESCRDWNGRLQEYLASIEPFDLIINSNSSLVTFGNQAAAAAYAKTVQSQVERGTKWLVIRDNPKPIKNFIPCISAAGAKARTKCANTREAALIPPDILPDAVKQLPGVIVADFTDVFCAKKCPPIIHDVLVYRDRSHITQKFSRLMQPKLRAIIPEEFKQ
ncbi:MAG: hypothetical protein RL670_877 [Actinomycetota bacterium]